MNSLFYLSLKYFLKQNRCLRFIRFVFFIMSPIVEIVIGLEHLIMSYVDM